MITRLWIKKEQWCHAMVFRQNKGLDGMMLNRLLSTPIPRLRLEAPGKANGIKICWRPQILFILRDHSSLVPSKFNTFVSTSNHHPTTIRLFLNQPIFVSLGYIPTKTSRFPPPPLERQGPEQPARPKWQQKKWFSWYPLRWGSKLRWMFVEKRAPVIPTNFGTHLLHLPSLFLHLCLPRIVKSPN